MTVFDLDGQNPAVGGGELEKLQAPSLGSPSSLA